jgi:hypothetical protein
VRLLLAVLLLAGCGPRAVKCECSYPATHFMGGPMGSPGDILQAPLLPPFVWPSTHTIEAIPAGAFRVTP